MKPQRFANTPKNFSRSLRCAMVALTVLAQIVSGATSTQTTKLCSNPVPGLDKMSLGIDITVFDIYSKKNSDLKHEVIQFTCNEGKKKLIDGVQYDMPDQVDSVTAVPGGLYNSVVTLVKTYDQTRTAVTGSLTAGGLFKQFGFSSSYSLKFMQESILNKSRYIETVSAFESAHRAQLLPDYILTLNQRVEDYVDKKLVADFDPRDPATTVPYLEFIVYYGTHYFQSANFGGLLRADLETKTDYYLRHNDLKVKAQSRASFWKILEAKGSMATERVGVDEAFEAMTTSHAEYFGGSANLLQPGGYQKWQPTVSAQPWLFNGHLVPIYELIRNPSKKASMKKAVIDYVLRAYLGELSRLLSSRRSQWENGLVAVQQLQKRVDDSKNRLLLTGDDMTVLSKAALAQVTVPEWFLEKTRKCYDWFPNDGVNCRGPTRHLCVSPSLTTKTTGYKNDPSGCDVPWGLPARQDDWFTGLKLCFRWDNCDGEWMMQFCKSVRELTTSLNAIADKGRNCRVSWKIAISGNDPAWQHNMRLCFVWRPDQAGGDCGGGLCAHAGRWTRYHPERMKVLHTCLQRQASPDPLPGASGSKCALLGTTAWLHLSYLLLVRLICNVYLQ